MALEWLVPLAVGALSASGTSQSNAANLRIAREQMRFQERMSSTAAQRSAADYAAAGLNPALAYDRPSSSPSGSTAQMGDPVSSGVHSAMSAKTALANLNLIKAQTAKTDAEGASAYADAAIKMGVTAKDEPTYRDEAMARRRAAIRDMQFTGQLQPHQLQKAKLEALLLGTDVNRKEFMSSLFGSARDIDTFIRRGFERGPEAAEAARAWGAVGLSSGARAVDRSTRVVRRKYTDFTKGGVLDPNPNNRWWNR